MKVLVTGGNGFIGQYVVETLIDCGHVPLIFDHHSFRASTIADTFLGDIRDATAVTEAMARVEGFIHLAAVLGTQETIQNPIPAAMTNLEGGLNILQAAAQYGTPGVYIGVGNHWMNNTYSISKTQVERFIKMYNKERGTRVNTVRVMNAYGPRQVAAPPYGSSKVRKITPSFICRALHNDPIEIYGDGKQVSDMVYVQDVAEVLVSALEYADQGIVSDDAIEVGPQHHNTVNEIAELIIDIADSRSEIVYLPMRPGEEPGASVTADTSTLAALDMNALNFISLKTGMTKTVDYFRDHK